MAGGHAANYIIAGKSVPAKWLAVGTLFSTAAAAAFSMRGGDSKPAPKVDAIKEAASSSEEETFIRNFMKEAEESALKGAAKSAAH